MTDEADETKDASDRPRPLRDVEAALRWVEAEMVVNPTRMGPRDTGPALIHLAVVRDVLLEKIRGGR